MSLHRNFKLTNGDLSAIFRSPRQLVLFVLVFTTVIFCAAILLKIDTKAKQGSLKILSKAEWVEDESTPVMADNYKEGVKGILNNYLVARTSEEYGEIKFCQDLVSQTVEQILNLVVPVDFKKLHLNLVVLLDKESGNCEKQDKKVKTNLDKEWGEFLEEYGWLGE